MNQGILAFVIDMDSVFTTDVDNEIHITCTNNALRKRQFTMHVFINSGEGDSRDGHIALACKGSPNGRRKVVEKLAYDSRVPIHFQKNAWVDTIVIIQLAEEFVQRTKDRHNSLG